MVTTHQQRAPASTLVKAITTVVATAIIATLAIIVDGYDAQEVPRLEAGVWVVRDDGQYARFNTEVSEFDTVRSVAEPAGMVQSGSLGFIFTHGYSKSWPIDFAEPTDLVNAADAAGDDVAASGSSLPTPPGTTFAALAGENIVYRTSNGEAYLGLVPTSGEPATAVGILNPFLMDNSPEGEEPPRYVIDAIAVNEDGTVAMYSGAEQAVRRYDATAHEFIGGPVSVPEAPESGTALELTIVGSRWVLSSSSAGLLWIEGHGSPLATELNGDALLQATPSDADEVFLADSTGLVAVSVGDGALRRVVDADGTPAAPVEAGGTTYAAWLTSASGVLWSSDMDGTRPLLVDSTLLQDIRVIAPVFRSNGDRAVLSEMSTGMVWTLPDGDFVPVKAWNSLDDTDVVEGTVKAADIVEQRSPTAVDDVFGVRRGALVSLPSLLNDYDPNKKDVLTIDPASVSALSDTSFGDVSLVNDDQLAVVRVSAASGSAYFTYAVTDGMATSTPATVTLTVVANDINSAPVWCGVLGCVQQNPSPQVAPGGYVTLQVLDDWVDPEGDPLVLSDAKAVDPSAPVSIVPSADGRIVIRHLDPNAGADAIEITITVTDVYGASTDMTIALQVTPSPALIAEPIALSTGLGELASVDINDYVSGGSGAYRLVNATISQARDDTLSLAPNASIGTIDITASAPGRYVANYTVEDISSRVQQTATLRVTVADGKRPLSIPPLTAFVRPHEDSTIDVLSAAQNASGRVLLVSDASSTDPRLSVSAVGQGLVRVSGTSEFDDPGYLGSAIIEIADGAGGTASTELAVFQLPASHGVGPIAAPDAISVRAGTQVDIPVLANDIGPRGERVLLHPQIEASGTPGELAFASGDMLRYLAPEVPGTYQLRYSVYLENDPGRVDIAPVTVTVLGPGSNRPPQPPNLTARVLAGQSVNIPIIADGADPDGDPVAVVDITQPPPGSGVVSISSSGQAIEYHSPAGGVPGGQVTFSYTLDDGVLQATGSVRVGVLLTDVSDIAPITYSDYVSLRLGATDAAMVSPLLNDHDPALGKLELIDIKPNALPGSEEYDRLADLIDDTTSLDGGIIALRAGDIEGTHSYVYTVQSHGSFSTAEGLIIVGVSTTPAPETLTVTDTVVSLSARHQLKTGIDVVSNKVRWQTGNLDDLKLALWEGAPDGFSVSGWTIIGSPPDKSTVVPFSLTGVDTTGQEIVTYGFLRIPAFEDMRLQLRPGIAAISVGEEQTVEFSLREELDLGPTDVLELRQDDSFAVQRDAARCVPTSAQSVSYAAGREAPWTDRCAVVVRLVGQETWSTVGIPIVIQPKDPRAILNPLSRTISPGEIETINLIDSMITWEGGRVGDTSALALKASYSGQLFVVTVDGATVTAQAQAGARPGSRETIIIESPAYGGLRSGITLVVGAAIPDAPVGASFRHVCTVSAGDACLIPAVGKPGEYDPFAGKPGAGLKIESVGTTGSVECPVATVTMASPTSLRATWPAGPRPVGGECVASFTVVDAQGRAGPGELMLDVQGYPQSPSSVTTVGFGPTSVTLLVTLGPATQAHPAVTGVAIYKGGTKVDADCSAGSSGTYRCVVDGLVNGKPETFTARAVNAVGESLDTSAHTTWAYDAPRITGLTATPVYDNTRTTATKGAVDVVVSSSSDTDRFRIVNTGEFFKRTGDDTHLRLTLEVGVQQLQVIPISKFETPISGDNSGSVAETGVTVAGSPSFQGTPVGAAIPDPSGVMSVYVSGVTFNSNYSANPPSLVWVAWRNSTPTCTMAEGGQPIVTGNAITSTSPTIGPLEKNRKYKIAVCGSNGFGAALSLSGTTFTWKSPDAPTGILTYSVNTSWSPEGNQYATYLTSGPSIDPRDQMAVYFWYDGGSKSEAFALSSESVQNISVAYCAVEQPDSCGPALPISKTSGSPPTTTRVTFLSACVSTPAASDVTISQAARTSASVSFTPTDYVVTWGGAFASLNPLTVPINLCPPPNPPPSPSPSPGGG